MQGPYRERVCRVCGSTGAPLVECTMCRHEACAPCLQEGVCKTCHERALELVLRRLATHGPGPIAPPPRSSRLVTALRVASVALLSTMALAVIPRALCLPPAPQAAVGAAFQPVFFPFGARHTDARTVSAWSPHDPRAMWTHVCATPVTCVAVRVGEDVLAEKSWEREILALRRIDLGWRTQRIVRDLDPRSFLASIGVEEGDVIVSVNNYDIDELAGRRTEDGFAVLHVERGRNPRRSRSPGDIFFGIGSTAHLR